MRKRIIFGLSLVIILLFFLIATSSPSITPFIYAKF